MRATRRSHSQRSKRRGRTPPIAAAALSSLPRSGRRRSERLVRYASINDGKRSAKAKPGQPCQVAEPKRVAPLTRSDRQTNTSTGRVKTKPREKASKTRAKQSCRRRRNGKDGSFFDLPLPDVSLVLLAIYSVSRRPRGRGGKKKSSQLQDVKAEFLYFHA